MDRGIGRSLGVLAALFLSTGSLWAALPSTTHLAEVIRQDLESRFARAYVHVSRIRGPAVYATVMAIPHFSDGRGYDDFDATRLALRLRRDVLRTFDSRSDFETGSQFSILGPGTLVVRSQRPEFDAIANRVSHGILANLAARDLVVETLGVEARTDHRVMVDLQARGVELGPQRRILLRNQVEDLIRDQVVPSVSVHRPRMAEESFVEVWDAEIPEEDSPVDFDALDDLEERVRPPEPKKAGSPSSRYLHRRVERDFTGTKHRPYEGSRPKDRINPSRAALAIKSKRGFRPGEATRLIRELRARRPWRPRLPPAKAAPKPLPDAAREYPAAPFGIGPGVASCELFVFFDTDKSRVKEPEVKLLDEFLAKVPADSIRSVVAIGHADSRHTNPYNMALGSRRAQAVQRFLETRGVPAARVRTVSYGEEAPWLGNKNQYQRALNRRVHLQVHFQDPDRIMHSDRVPLWREKRTWPFAPRHDAKMRPKALDAGWPVRRITRTAPGVTLP